MIALILDENEEEKLVKKRLLARGKHTNKEWIFHSLQGINERRNNDT